ncbi:FecR/PupR family sigma factor regulator [Thalassotalea ponticola]|uniref:FecR/PupR family sigma factor regulator n=1 Tax=Thalassotalea ponticola TaxID=1523392 RepID=UPI0025B45202|nr:FecR/PupR family sigma factor regulator [Thalassotalea ponticola]MDN3653926.1 FecR/PupR family sigma factor regulator [Thalassotalea ponticola]
MSLEEWLVIGVPDEIADQAMTWIAIFDSDQVTQQQHQKFQLWIEQDPTHLWAFEELSEFWAKSHFGDGDALSLLAFNNQPHVSVESTEPQQQPTHSNSRYPTYATISLVLCLIGALAAL